LNEERDDDARAKHERRRLCAVVFVYFRFERDFGEREKERAVSVYTRAREEKKKKKKKNQKSSSSSSLEKENGCLLFPLTGNEKTADVEKLKKEEQQKGKTQDASYQHGEGGDRFVDGFFFHPIRRGRVVVCTHISLPLMRFFFVPESRLLVLFLQKKLRFFMKTLNFSFFVSFVKIQKKGDKTKQKHSKRYEQRRTTVAALNPDRPRVRGDKISSAAVPETVVRDVQNVVSEIFPLRARREAIAVDDFKVEKKGHLWGGGGKDDDARVRVRDHERERGRVESFERRGGV